MILKFLMSEKKPDTLVSVSSRVKLNSSLSTMWKKIPRFKKSNLSPIDQRNQSCFQHRSCGLLKYVMFSHAGAVHECELSKLIKTCRLPQFQFSNCHNLYLSQIKFIFVRRRDGRVFELVKLVPITIHWQRDRPKWSVISIWSDLRGRDHIFDIFDIFGQIWPVIIYKSCQPWSVWTLWGFYL